MGIVNVVSGVKKIHPKELVIIDKRKIYYKIVIYFLLKKVEF